MLLGPFIGLQIQNNIILTRYICVCFQLMFVQHRGLVKMGVHVCWTLTCPLGTDVSALHYMREPTAKLCNVSHNKVAYNIYIYRDVSFSAFAGISVFMKSNSSPGAVNFFKNARNSQRSIWKGRDQQSGLSSDKVRGRLSLDKVKGRDQQSRLSSDKVRGFH